MARETTPPLDEFIRAPRARCVSCPTSQLFSVSSGDQKFLEFLPKHAKILNLLDPVSKLKNSNYKCFKIAKDETHPVRENRFSPRNEPISPDAGVQQN